MNSHIPHAYGPTSLEVPYHFTPEQTLAVLREIRKGIENFNHWAAAVFAQEQAASGRSREEERARWVRGTDGELR